MFKLHNLKAKEVQSTPLSINAFLSFILPCCVAKGMEIVVKRIVKSV